MIRRFDDHHKRHFWYFKKDDKYFPLTQEGPFVDWLVTKCSNEQDDGDTLTFLIERFLADRLAQGITGPETQQSLLSQFASLGHPTPFVWRPSPQEWVSLYSTPSTNGQSVCWLAQRFLESRSDPITESNLAAVIDVLRIAGYTPNGVNAPTNVSLVPTIPRVHNTVEPVDVEIYFHTRGPSR